VRVNLQVAQTLPVVAEQAVRRKHTAVVQEAVCSRLVVVGKQAACRQPGAVEVVARRLVVVGIAAYTSRRCAEAAQRRAMVEVAQRRAVVEAAAAAVVVVGTARRRFGYMAA
jgi:hypothetical protein